VRVLSFSLFMAEDLCRFETNLTAVMVDVIAACIEKSMGQIVFDQFMPPFSCGLLFADNPLSCMKVFKVKFTT